MSHFVMSDGDINALQKILGHSSIVMATRYKHLSPDYLAQSGLLDLLALGWPFWEKLKRYL